jgi:cellulose synthase/poly-beta-1,6-N-acetylglucosamine synthase-like glycosyltransferase
MGLKAGRFYFAKYEFLICIDGDALLAPEAATWMIRHFIRKSKCRCCYWADYPSNS